MLQTVSDRFQISWVSPAIFALALLVASTVALTYEIVPFLSQHASPATRFTSLESTNVKSALSIYSHRLLLNDCLEALAGPTGLVQPFERRSQVTNNCHSIAMNTVKTMPTFALAWYVAAFASAELGNYPAFNTQLAVAQKTAPNEQWLAELRVRLAEANLDHLSPEALEGENRDLLLLARSRQGVASIASRYIAQPEFRERIIRLVETLSEDEQKRFISHVRGAAKQLSIRAKVQ